MRRDMELVRGILQAVGGDNCRDTDELIARLKEQHQVSAELINYHLKLMVQEAHLLTGHWIGGGISIGTSEPSKRGWHELTLTWTGNNFLDAVNDDKAWNRIKKGLAKGGAVVGIETLKAAAQALVPLGVALALAEQGGSQVVARKGS